jgi:hypothetical protein
VNHHRARYLRVSLLLLSLLSFGFLTKCGAPPEYAQLLKLPREQQLCEFKKLPVDKQIEFYLYSRTGEPPRPDFDYALASEGAKVIPTLLQRLRSEPAEYRQVDMILLFELMNREYIDLKNDKVVIGGIEEVVAKMKDSSWKGMAQKSLTAIKERVQMLPPAYNLPPCEQPSPGN